MKASNFARNQKSAQVRWFNFFSSYGEAFFRLERKYGEHEAFAYVRMILDYALWGVDPDDDDSEAYGYFSTVRSSIDATVAKVMQGDCGQLGGRPKKENPTTKPSPKTLGENPTTKPSSKTEKEREREKEGETEKEKESRTEPDTRARAREAAAKHSGSGSGRGLDVYSMSDEEMFSGEHDTLSLFRSAFGNGFWSKAIRTLGEGAMLEELGNFVHEVRAGEVPDNPGAAMTARLQKLISRKAAKA